MRRLLPLLMLLCLSAPAFGASTLLDGLVAYWKLDETSGTRVDAHGANDLTDNNSVLFTNGIINNAAQLVAASSEFLSITDNAAMSTGDIDYTFTFWFKLDSLGTELIILSKYGGAGDREYRVNTTTANKLQFRIFDGSVVVGTALDTTILTTGVWYFGAVWHDASGDTVNGQVDNGTPVSAATSGSSVDGAESFMLGARSGPLNPFNGAIDEVGFWKRVLTSDERTELYGAGSPPAYPFTTTETGEITGMSVHPDGDKLLMWTYGIHTNGLVFTSGLATNAFTGNERLRIDFEEYGFDDVGQLIKVPRTVYGTAHDTFTYPANSTYRATYDGETLHSVIWLDETIFAASSNIVATVLTNLVSDGTNGNIAATVTVTNNSTAAYDRPQLAPTTVGYTDTITNRADGAFTFSAIGVHGEAQQRRPVRVLSAWAVEGANNSGTQFCAIPFIHQTRFRNAKAWEHVVNIPYANLTTGEVATVHYTAYPWFGSNALSSADAIHTYPSAYWAGVPLMCDKDGSMRRWYATVDPSSAGTGAYATNYTGVDYTSVTNAISFATIGDAYAAVISSNASASYATFGLYPSNYVWITGTPTSGTAPNPAPVFRPMPWATATDVVFNAESGASSTDDLDDRMIFREVTMASNVNNTWTSEFIAWFDCIFDSTANTPISGTSHQYVVNCRVNNFAAGFTPLSTQAQRWALLLGIEDYAPAGVTVYPYTVAGYYRGVTNTTSKTLFRSPAANHTAGMPTNVIIVGVQALGGVSVGSAFNTIGDQHFTDGFWMSDSTFEVINTAGSGVMNFWTDQATATNTPNKNITKANITEAGNRNQNGYNDGSALALSRGPFRFVNNLMVGSVGFKSSDFADDASMTNNLSVMWGHRFRGNLHSQFESIAADTFTNDFPGINSWVGADFRYGPFWHQFVDYRANDGTNWGAGVGDYRLTSKSPHWQRAARLKDQKAMTPFDSRGFRRDRRDPPGDLVAGNPRKGDML